MLLVLQRIEAAARRTIAPEKKRPRLKPMKKESTMVTTATRKPTLMIPPRKEKSFLVEKAIKVNPANMAAVIIPACPIRSGALRNRGLAATRRMGRKIAHALLMH